MTGDDDGEAKLPHIILVNHEEQYSLWRADIGVPAGWRQVFGPAGKADCLDYVNKTWTDMRPLSLRKAIEADAQADSGH
jgi:MbtH protein